MVDIIIILIIGAYCAWVIYSNFIKKKDPDNCNGVCSGCSKCSSPLEDYYKDHKGEHNNG